jgi:hypothetical protein
MTDGGDMKICSRWGSEEAEEEIRRRRRFADAEGRRWRQLAKTPAMKLSPI